MAKAEIVKDLGQGAVRNSSSAAASWQGGSGTEIATFGK
jgi:hypothetical protein